MSTAVDVPLSSGTDFVTIVSREVWVGRGYDITIIGYMRLRMLELGMRLLQVIRGR